MKKLLLSLLLLVSVFSTFGQSKVDIELINNPTNCQILIYPSNQEFSILSNIVFTLRWRETQNITLGDPQPTNLITILKSGPVHTIGGWKYQIYSGCGLNPGWIQPILLSIPKIGKGDIIITNDYFVTRPNINGKYYVSIGGQNVTGDIINKEKSIENSLSTIIMYFDPSSKQFYIKRENEYYNMVGQKVILFNINELIIVHKNKQ
jgi:hypothetical protein